MKRSHITLTHGFARLALLSPAILLIAISVAQFAEAQVTNASISGTVTDASGALVPGIEVKATQIETNFTRSATTDSAGQYTINFLPIGSYRLEISAKGFKTFSQTGIVLEIGKNARVDPVVQVGEVSETVSITANAPLINTADASIGRTVENKEILNLPLVNRDVYTLLTLTPGVDSTEGTNPFGSPAQISVVNGSPSGTGSINYFLDGGNNTAGGRNTGNALPNPDAVQEFRVITNSYGAEFGRFAGGMLDVVTKSGTNSLHGSLFHFLRNDVLNATPWNVRDKPALRRNQFGGSFGGPIIKDRSFFFGSYSGLRQREVDIRSTAVVPTALERLGDFSASATRPRDPLTNTAFAGGIIPTGRLDPTALNILRAAIPAANLPNNQFQATVPHPENNNEFVIKLDHKLSDAHQLTGSYFFQKGNEIEGLVGTGNLPWSTRAFAYKQQNYNIGETWTISPTLVNQLRLTFVRNFGERTNAPTQTLADFGSGFRVQGTPSLPQIAVTGFFTLGKAIAGPIGSNYYGLRETLSWNKGRHFLKLGGEAQLEKNILDSLLNNYG
ncbi:MAG: carboxypeptidase regulatory-like domain-containing protein, partial [Blastocatellia bacterium]